MKIRLCKALTDAGIAARRKCEALIFEKKVTVNNEVASHPAFPVDPEIDEICVNGTLLPKIEKKVYFLLNKPAGFVCTTLRTSVRRKLVLDLFNHLPFRLFTVGRLDKETTGLLLVTNDGEFAQRVIHPSFNIEKEYVAKTSHEITADHLKAISKGCWIDGSYIKPVSVRKVRKGTLKIVVKEGKKREVRQLLENQGLAVLDLCRIRIGPLQLGALPLGGYRPLTTAEIETFSLNSKKFIYS